ncbi:repair protein [Streptococcus pneumoniae]|nr:repair protein [Streptococcus pneumoniae]
MAPLVEEPLKLLPLVFVLALIPVRKLKSLFLLGIASGLGFQMIEDIGYIRTDLPEGFDFTISRILERIILFNSPFVELETELPLAIPVVTAIALYGFYHAYCFVEKHNELMT